MFFGHGLATICWIFMSVFEVEIAIVGGIVLAVDYEIATVPCLSSR